MKVNKNFDALQENYLFAEIDNRVEAYMGEYPGKKLLRLGIGDVTQPLCQAAVTAMEQAAAEMGTAHGFRGYGPYRGYGFLLDAVQAYYGERGVALKHEEIFVSDGAKSDLGNFIELFDRDNTVLIPDPVYPAYVDTNIMAGKRIIYMEGTEKNGFLPLPEKSIKADVIYLCSPNNPTGAVYNKEQLKQWVDYANGCGAVILFDAAYEVFIRDDTLPHSIYEIEGARGCAVEFCSLSKTAGFTGVRCGYTIVPWELVRDGRSLSRLWLRRQTAKYNGVPYIIQRGAEAVFTAEGRRQTAEQVAYYLENTRLMGEGLGRLGITYFGGSDSPYIWLKCPGGLGSWDFFDRLLQEIQVIGTPGAGFGKNGEGFFRLTGFGRREDVQLAVERMAGMEL